MAGAAYLWLFALSIDYFFLVPSGIVAGYPLAFPLMPLAIKGDCFLWSLPYIGQGIMLACLLLSAAFSVWGYYQQKMRMVLCSLAFLSPFFVGFFFPKIKYTPEFVDACCWLHLTSSSKNAYERAEEISLQLNKCVHECSSVHTIFIGESAYPFAINGIPSFVESWMRILALGGCELLLGTHILSQCRTLHNGIACIVPNCPIMYHQKKMCMPLVEYLPSFLHYFGAKAFFLQECLPLMPDASPRKTMVLACGQAVEPYVCAEFFLSHRPTFEEIPILCLARDGWFNGNIIAQRMLLHAQYKACLWQRPILYVTDSCGFFLDKCGKMSALRTVQ